VTCSAGISSWQLIKANREQLNTCNDTALMNMDPTASSHGRYIGLLQLMGGMIHRVKLGSDWIAHVRNYPFVSLYRKGKKGLIL
jgi:hypothetical protein